MRLPVFASASQRSMKTWPRETLPFDRNAMRVPSFDSDGARKIAPSVSFGVEQWLGELARPVEAARAGQQPDLQVLAPLVAEVVERFAELALERAFDADARHRSS